MNEIAKNSSYIIEALTPIHIGNGKTYPPFEHFTSGGKLVRLDFYRLCEDPAFIAMRDQITKAMLERVPLFKIAPDLAKKYPLYEVDNLEVEEKAEVKEFIKTRGKPYIPGSSVKGAILTAMLFKKIKEGELEIEGAGNPKKIGSDIVNRLTKILGGEFGNRWLRVTDSSCFEASKQLAAGKVSVFPKGPTIYMEFLKPGASANLEIHQVSSIEVEDALQAADELYREVLERENLWLKQNDLEPLKFDGNGYLLRLGSGSSRLATSISILTEREIRHLSGPELRPPKTRKVVDGLKKTMGWAMVWGGWGFAKGQGKAH